MKTIPLRIRIIIYLAVFFGTAAVTYILAVREPKAAVEDTKSSMGYASLPVIYMSTESGINYNYLFGYRGEVDTSYLHDVVTPISSDRVLPIHIIQYGNVLSDISYEIRSLDRSKLIERNSLNDYKSRDGVIAAELKFRNLLDAGEEYMLKITLNSEKSGEIDYYTRLIIMDDANIDRKLTYVKNFSEYTFSEDTLDKIKAKLETNSSGDNTNLGRVDIHCKLSQVGYGKLTPILCGERYISINEITATTASITLNFRIKTQDATGSYSYNVREFLRINQPDATVTYVYNYERFMDQVFETRGAVSQNGEIYIGIMSDEDIVTKQSYDKKITCFVYRNELWEYNATSNHFVKIFSFAESESDFLRESNARHGVKILNVANSGKVDYAVYGYMNRGMHEGELGISVFSYDPETYTAKEIVFIPRTDVYKSIERDVDTLLYFNSDQILYLYINESIYYIDCTTKESMTIAANVSLENCILCESNAMLAYQSAADINECDTVNIIYLNTGEQTAIKAQKSNERLKVLGFIDEKLVYGVARREYIEYSTHVDYRYLMDKLYIVDKELELVREFYSEGYFINDTDFTGEKIILYRVQLNEEGQVVLAPSTQLLSNEYSSGSNVELTSRATDVRQKEIYINLPITTVVNRGIDRTAKYQFESQNVVNLIVGESSDESVAVFSYGVFYGIYDRAADAIAIASSTAGVVVNNSGRRIWDRYKSKESTIAVSDEDIQEYDSAVRYLSEHFEGAFSLNGCEIELALYYVYLGYPIIAKTGEDSYEMIYAYNSNNVMTIDFTSNTRKTYTKKDFDAKIGVYGAEMFTCGL